jgi:hypothetical protein
MFSPHEEQERAQAFLSVAMAQPLPDDPEEAAAQLISIGIFLGILKSIECMLADEPLPGYDTIIPDTPEALTDDD